MQNLHIVTGGSKGIGAGIAKYFSEHGDQVVSLARSEGARAPLVRHYRVDLSERIAAVSIFEKIFSDFPQDRFNKISLINNAGVAEPLSQVEKNSDNDIFKNLMINLYAPISLTAAFLQKT